METKEFDQLRKEEGAVMLYFYAEHCGVCRDLYPKVRALVHSHFPRLRLERVDAEASRELAGQLRMLSIPGVLVYFEGSEHFRANGYLSLDLLREQIRRPYRQYFSPAG